MKTLTARLFEVLGALGTTADDVADALLAGGWTGLRQDGMACPVSNYVLDVMPDAEVAAVALSRITVITVRGETVVETLPPGPEAFVWAFDAGAYDDLAAVITGDDGEVIDDLER